MVCAARSVFKREERRNRDQEYIKSRGLKDSVGTEVGDRSQSEKKKYKTRKGL